RIVGRAIARDMPVPPHLRPGIVGTNLMVVGMLPDRVRRAFGLTWTPAHQAVFLAGARAVRASQAVVPDRVRLGPNFGLFRLVARTEQRLLDSGRSTMDLPAA